MNIEKPSLKDILYRLIPFCIVVCCLWMILVIGRHILRIPNDDQLLDVLILNQETEPVFYVTSQVYDKVIQKVENRKGSHELNLVLNLADYESYDKTQFIQKMSELCDLYPYVTLSVLPSDDMTDVTYLNSYQEIALLLNDLPVYLIAYPISTNHFAEYTIDTVEAIGVVIEKTEDMAFLDKIYAKYADVKPIVVRDAIKAHYNEDSALAVKTITECYYLMAVQYPAVEVIFSPYTKTTDSYTDAYSLTSSDKNYYLFYTIYNRLFDKPWITTQYNTPLVSLSPYRVLNDYDTVSGTIELILNPEALVLSDYNEVPLNEGELFFRFNETYLTVNSSYPYAIELDTTSSPNGLSRLTALLNNNMMDTTWLYSIDINIENPILIQRAKRIPTVTTPNTTRKQLDSKYIPVLMYHSIVEDIGDLSESSHVEVNLFDAQMAALLNNGYTPINFLDLKNYVEGRVNLPEKPVLITMDDGYLNNYTLAFPVYKKYNIQATLFVSAFYVPIENTQRHFGWKAAQEMEDSGLIDIQSHGYNHTPFSTLSKKNMLYQASLSKGIIESHLGKRDVSVLAYPQFMHNLHSLRLLKRIGYDFQITDLARVPVLTFKPKFAPPELQRINVPNTMSPDELIETLAFYTK